MECDAGPILSRPLDAVVAEVTNTPWGERHAYAVAADGKPVLSARFRKAFHVSPLMGMDHEYELRVTQPGETANLMSLASSV